MIYEWKTPIVKADAQIAGEMCEELSRTVGLTAKNLLDANRREDAPLHGEFEWDDGIAAENWRENQASAIIRCLIVKPEPKEEPVRAFINIVAEKREYIPLTTVINTPDLHSQMLENAHKELIAFQKKYARLTELNSVFEAIGALKI